MYQIRTDLSTWRHRKKCRKIMWNLRESVS